ncbi:MAG TPA: MFS transporter, partial [Pseudomonadota bacterium]|nr:MFS transporter [Pseudomonadota bacterium]
RLAAMKQFLMSRGADLATAEIGARRMLGGLVMQQAMVLSFEKLFLLAGIAFLCVLPLIFFLRAPQLKTTRVAADVHIEA